MALLLEPFARPMIGGPTPLYLIDAPIRGAGKGLMADVACLTATGRKADVMTLVRSDAEEHEKRITALLLAGEHRSILVSACLSIVHVWLDAGCPEGQTTLGSYESWSRILGGILGVSGVSGFLGGRERLYSESDRETADWCALCERWWLAHACLPATAKDVFEVAKAHGLLLSVWGGRTDLAAQQRFGHALAAIRDRVFEALRVRSAGRDSRTGNAAYRLEAIRDKGKTLETPETHIAHVETQAVPGGSGRGEAGVFGDDAPKTPGDNGCFTETPVLGSKNTIKESKAYGISGVSGVLGAGWPTESNTDEEVIDL
jgi:hypothetical protein